ncbi:MAG: hypothetical protein WB763_17425 [Terriglobia bacterium]
MSGNTRAGSATTVTVYSSDKIRRKIETCKASGWRQELDLRSTYFTVADAAQLVKEEGFNRLTLLNLGGNKLGTDGMRVLAGKLPATLTTLQLGNAEIGDEGAHALAENMPTTLITLKLRGNEIGPDGARALAGKLPATLATLDLEFNKIGDDGARALAENLPPTLTTLNLGDNNIGKDGLRALAEKFPATLMELSLNFHYLVEDVAGALAGKLPATLKSLDLSNSNMGDDGMRAFAETLPPTLTRLILSDAGFNLDGLRALLAKLPTTLTELNLSGNRIDDDCIREITGKLPTTLTTLSLSWNHFGAEYLADLIEPLLPSGAAGAMARGQLREIDVSRQQTRLPMGLEGIRDPAELWRMLNARSLRKSTSSASALRIAKTGDPYVDSCFDFTFARDSDPRKLEEMSEMANLPGLVDGGEYAKAEQAIMVALAQFPDFYFPHIWKGIALKRQGRFADAKAAYLAGTRASTRKRDLCANLGYLELEHGTLRDAVCYWVRSALLQFASDEISDPVAFLYLMYIAILCGEHDAAEELRRFGSSLDLGQNTKAILGSKLAREGNDPSIARAVVHLAGVLSYKSI